ncbi:hypothetical protein NLJ89_g9660 [Agrocybe chaxingu]|uniref:Uncharacterized protein n=1 Tax=Agrocybe chaxingu TaxID=84603 RepID=A0A9W8JVG7_9AGAR|nr:hypothetical protein NLJ89_g9660 [Agrocybe chaxingu]
MRQTPMQSGGPASPEELSGPNKTEPQTPSTPGGLMSRLKNFGKITKRPVSDTPSVAALAIPTAETPTISEGTATLIEVTKTPLQKLLSEPLNPPSSADAPLHAMPPNTTVLISVEASPSYTTIYRGIVSNTHNDVEALEEAMPMWLVEYLLTNQIPPSVPLAKISFVLVPWNKDPDVEPLPELLNTTQTKLTASRYLRVRKIILHVQDKLERMSAGSRAGSIRSSVEGQAAAALRPRAEDVYEILCNETLLSLEMTLAAVRQYIWKQSAELVLHYRRKRESRTPL